MATPIDEKTMVIVEVGTSPTYQVTPTKYGVIISQKLDSDKEVIDNLEATHYVEITDEIPPKSKLNALKHLNWTTGMGLKAAKYLLDSTPGVLIFGSEKFCDNLVSIYRELHIQVEVKEVEKGINTHVRHVPKI